jgi:phosphoglycerate dehydrogenase-like enzyme
MNVLVGVISHAAAWVIPRSFIDQLRGDFPQHTFADAWDVGTIRQLIPDADVAFVPDVDREMLVSARRLRWIQSPSVGVGAMLYPEMVASPVVITIPRGVRSRAIAEHVLGVSVALARQFQLAIRRQVGHRWAQDELEGPTTSIITLRGRRMGIVGLGSIGSEVARLAVAFGLRVSAVRRRRIAEERLDAARGVDEVLPPERLDDLLKTADIVVLSAPQTSSTVRLIGAHELSQMRRGAYFINIARGTLVDDDALIAALRSGHLGGAALDVFADEPLNPASPYWDMPNVIVTPHTSGAMADSWASLVALFSENLRRFEAGQPMLNVVDKRAGY